MEADEKKGKYSANFVQRQDMNWELWKESEVTQGIIYTVLYAEKNRYSYTDRSVSLDTAGHL